MHSEIINLPVSFAVRRRNEWPEGFEYFRLARCFYIGRVEECRHSSGLLLMAQLLQFSATQKFWEGSTLFH